MSKSQKPQASLAETFFSRLEAQAKLRSKYSNCEWVAAERELMHHLVNQERKARGLAKLLVSEIERVELLAVGHSDYTRKFALYCAELAAKEVPR
jgi:hypothetical protein